MSDPNYTRRDFLRSAGLAAAMTMAGYSTSYSGHSDRNQLVNYLRSLNPKPKRILVDHGEKDTAVEFARYIANKFRINATALRDLDSVRLK